MNTARSQLEALLQSVPDADDRGLLETWDRVPDVPHGATSLPDADSAWARLNAALPAETTVATTARPSLRKRSDRPFAGRTGRRNWLRAGVFASTLAIALLALGILRPAITRAPPGPPTSLVLEDGTTVLLRPGSALSTSRVPGWLGGEERGVHLDGEAFFDVAKTGSRFTVSTSDARIEVLGTRFNVRAWPTETGTVVQLVEGSVRLVPLSDASTGVTMAPKQRRRVARGGMGVRALPSDAGSSMGWRTDQLVYKNEPLRSVLDDVERRFGTTVSSSANALRSRRVSVALRRPESIESVLHDLALSLNLEYSKRADGFDIHDATPPAP